MKRFNICIFNPTRIQKRHAIPGVIVDEAIQLSKKLNNAKIVVFLFHELGDKRIYYKRVNTKIILFAVPIESSYGIFNTIKSYPRSIIYQIVLYLRNIKKNKSSLIRCDDTLLTGLPAKLISMIFRIKRVILIAGSNKEILSHKLETVKISSLIKKFIMFMVNLVERFVVSNTTLLVISEELALYYSQLGGRTIVKTPTFLDLTLFSPKSEKTVRETINLLFVGRLEVEKGILDLIKAFKELKKHHSSIRLTIVGDGSMRKQIINLISKEKLSNDILLLGSVDHHKLPQIYHNADIFILPSYTEGLPVAMLEAMACKLPVIVSAVGQVPKVIRHKENGLIINPGDVNSLIKCVELLLSDKDFMSYIADNGYQFVKTHYNNYIPLHVATYKQLLNAKT